MRTEQGELFPPPPPAARDDVHRDADLAPVWLQRLSLVVLVIFCFYIGGLLLLLPWSARYWVQNGWLMAHPAWDLWAQRGWVRGMVSGLGMVDIWIGVSEMIHYRDFRA